MQKHFNNCMLPITIENELRHMHRIYLNIEMHLVELFFYSITKLQCDASCPTFHICESLSKYDCVMRE